MTPDENSNPDRDAQASFAAPSGSANFVRMFKPQFAPMVESGQKCQTVRPTPKRIPHPGDRSAYVNGPASRIAASNVCFGKVPSATSEAFISQQKDGMDRRYANQNAA